MASIFNSLHIGYTGLNAAQMGIDTTGHNVSNAETEGYSRQRVVTSSTSYDSSLYGQIGNGTQISNISRVFDQFVFNRYSSIAQSKEYSDTMKDTLEELSTYFPDIDNVGIKNDLQNYYDAWQSLADNPTNSAVKVALGQQAQLLTQHINQTRQQVADLQSSLNDQLGTNIDEVNRIAEQIAGLNKSINSSESIGGDANDLRDQRNQLELSLSKLIGSKVLVGQIQSNSTVDTSIAESDGSYSIQVGGFNIVDGSTFHPIGMDKSKNANGFYDLYYERQDGVRLPFAENVSGGKIGALLELRGSTMDANGDMQNGFLQETINNLDSFAKGLIEATNNTFAQSATTSMRSNALSFTDNQVLVGGSGENFSKGSFDVVVYDIDGNEVARRTITVDDFTVLDNSGSTLSDGTPNSIIEQMTASKDDTGDNNALNDINSMINPSFNTSMGIMQIGLKSPYSDNGYTFSIEDNGTNFAGVTGLNRFFDGNNADNMSVTTKLVNDPTLIQAYKSPADGDNQMALDMVDLQNKSVSFTKGTTIFSESIYGFYDMTATSVGSKANAVIANNDSITAQFNTAQQELDSVSKVSIDEEMANLIRYQTSYGAAAKVISTIDQMMTTLLGIKQ
ncbi:MAG: flagellar hook-associated protein FlgK [Sulfuricurvum sp.]